MQALSPPYFLFTKKDPADDVEGWMSLQQIFASLS